MQLGGRSIAAVFTDAALDLLDGDNQRGFELLRRLNKEPEAFEYLAMVERLAAAKNKGG